MTLGGRATGWKHCRCTWCQVWSVKSLPEMFSKMTEVCGDGKTTILRTCSHFGPKKEENIHWLTVQTICICIYLLFKNLREYFSVLSSFFQNTPCRKHSSVLRNKLFILHTLIHSLPLVVWSCGSIIYNLSLSISYLSSLCYVTTTLHPPGTPNRSRLGDNYTWKSRWVSRWHVSFDLLGWGNRMLFSDSTFTYWSFYKAGLLKSFLCLCTNEKTTFTNNRVQRINWGGSYLKKEPALDRWHLCVSTCLGSLHKLQ